MKNVKKLSIIIISILMLLVTVGCQGNEVTEYTVNLKYEDGAIYKTLQITEGENLTLEELTKDGYTFLGWYLNDVKQNDEFIPTTNVDLYAKFQINKYTYKFVDFDGKVLKEETVDYGSEIVAPSAPTRAETDEYRYEFKGWDKSFDAITSDIEIKALYEEIKKTPVDPDVPHTHTEEIIPGYDATCSKTGLTEGKKCSTCGEILVAQKEIAKVAHTEEVLAKKDATCTETGLTEGKKCSVCGEILVAQKEVAKTKHLYYEGKCLDCFAKDPDYNPANPHTHTEVVIPAKDATCKETGLTEGKKCSTCGAILVDQKEVAKVAHKEEVIPAKDATCTETGLTEGKKCSVCNEVIVAQKEVAKKDHNYVDGKCSVCSADDPNYQPDTNLDSLEGLKVSIMGDSISTFYADGSVMNSYYGGENQFFYPRYSTTIKTVDKTWWYQLITNNKMELGINNSWSGSMAYGSSSSSGQSDGRVNTIDDNGMPDVVLIFLGTNDCGSAISVANFRSAITTIINKIRKLGDPEILITALGYSDYNSNNYKSRRLEYNAEIRKIASEYSCGVVPLDQYIVETSYMFYLEDSLHYNAKGATLLSKIYEKSIKEYLGIPYTGTIEVEHQEPLPEGAIGKITATANSGFWTGYASNVYFTTASSAANAIYSTTYEITKNADNNKYYVTEINKSGASQGFNCDYVLMISDAHTEKTALLKLLNSVTVGSIVEFNENGSFPMDIIFKEGDGSAPSEPSTPDTPVTPPVDKVEGELNIGAFNDGVWTKYADTVIAYEQAKLGQGSKYINFYIIGLTKSSGNDYEITCLKPLNDSTFAFPQCDYYILIYMDLEEKSYYENAQVGDIVTINGDITSGVCSIAFK